MKCALYVFLCLVLLMIIIIDVSDSRRGRRIRKIDERIHSKQIKRLYSKMKHENFYENEKLPGHWSDLVSGNVHYNYPSVYNDFSRRSGYYDPQIKDKMDTAKHIPSEFRFINFPTYSYQPRRTAWRPAKTMNQFYRRKL